MNPFIKSSRKGKLKSRGRQQICSDSVRKGGRIWNLEYHWAGKIWSSGDVQGPDVTEGCEDVQDTSPLRCLLPSCLNKAV